MEEGEVKNTTKVKEEKIPYEQLKVFASQAQVRLNQCYEKIEQLETEKRNLIIALNAKDVELAFKALEFKELFPSEFISSIVDRIVYMLTPDTSENKEENKED